MFTLFNDNDCNYDKNSHNHGNNVISIKIITTKKVNILNIKIINDELSEFSNADINEHNTLTKRVYTAHTLSITHIHLLIYLIFLNLEEKCRNKLKEEITY